jgi:hypothetical protein
MLTSNPYGANTSLGVYPRIALGAISNHFLLSKKEFG